MRLKDGVNPVGIKPEVNLIIQVADSVYREKGYELVITSLNDSTHSDTSRHYQGMAVDFRTRHLRNNDPQIITQLIKERLGKQFLVLFERNHIHISYKPRRP